MKRYIMRACAAAAAASAVVAAIGTMADGAAGAPTATAATATTRVGIPGDQLWVRQFPDANSEGPNGAYVAVSPVGGRLFVTGNSGTVAYDAASGARLWAQPSDIEFAGSVAVSPDGSTVFITGDGPGTATSTFNYGTVAYNAATGAKLWESYYDPTDSPAAVAVSPDGSTVFVTGADTVAYNAATGAQLWAHPGSFADSIAIDRASTAVFTTGPGGTVAYNAATGAQLWAHPGSIASSIAVSPAGTAVFTIGGTTSNAGFATHAYDAATGTQLWAKRYPSPRHGPARRFSLTVSPAGGRVFVTGQSRGITSRQDYATVAYRAATGVQLWAKRYNGPHNGDDSPVSVAAGPSGRTVFVTGSSAVASGAEFATVAYRASTGARQWTRRYDGPSHADYVSSLAVSPDGQRIFVTGEILGRVAFWNYVTIAYHS